MRKYDEENKREALRKIQDGQYSGIGVAQVGVAESLLDKWKRDTVEAGSDAEKEALALGKRLREVSDGARHIKKAALIFGKSG